MALSVVVVQVLIMVGWAFCGARSDALGRHRPVLAGLGFNRFNGSSAGSLPARVLGSCCWWARRAGWVGLMVLLRLVGGEGGSSWLMLLT